MDEEFNFCRDTFTLEIVQNPFDPYRCYIFRVQEGMSRPLTWSELRYNALPWYRKLIVRILYHVINIQRRWKGL